MRTLVVLRALLLFTVFCLIMGVIGTKNHEDCKKQNGVSVRGTCVKGK